MIETRSALRFCFLHLLRAVPARSRNGLSPCLKHKNAKMANDAVDWLLHKNQDNLGHPPAEDLKLQQLFQMFSDFFE